VLNVIAAGEGVTRVNVLPATRTIVSWNSTAALGALELTVHTAGGRRSRPLPYVAFEPGRRASLDGFDDVAAIKTDVTEATEAIVAVDVHANFALVRVAASTPPGEAPRDVTIRNAGAVRELAVPERSQYVDAFPGERGWCAPASLSMLLGAWHVNAGVDEVAAGMFDGAYHGTGNWAFAIAYAAACGLAGAAAYLRDLHTAEYFIAAGLPLAASISWAENALPGAPLERSDGHILVIRGFDERGDVIVNDPAQPAVRHVYERAAFARCWLGHGGVALLIARPDRLEDLVRCANA
jgi:hypothetical protein